MHWKKQDSEYEKLVQNTNTFSNTIKESRLENSIDGLTEIRNVKPKATQLQVTSGTIISYHGHVSLLYSAAQRYDTRFSTRINSEEQKRTFYQHEANLDENNEEYDHHVDTNIEDLIINLTNFNVTQKHKNVHALPQPNGINYHMDLNRYRKN